ncbi:FAD-binding oxidoreductase [Apiospora arundinis]|uniref:FAD-binding oxidoreductase n=1 Tax=Apiospora arundinis TaxID=335852 RepID=A0ABR2IR00_9PEZI
MSDSSPLIPERRSKRRQRSTRDNMEKLSNVVQLVLGLGSLNSSSAAGSPSALSACQQLGATFPNNATFAPHDALYTPLAHAHWSETAWEQPTCIFLPENAAQLQTAIPLIVEHQSQFAIRAGGHLEAVGAASTNDGVLIDLSRLKRLEYHAEVQEAVLGPGLRWGDVYGYLDPFKVTVVGGRVLDVGVGGLPLGGGLSYLSDLHGMVCDNIVNYEVVLADGSLVNANAGSNPDLYRALKGGGNNFGIVTSYTLRTYPINDAWGGTKVFSWDKIGAVLDAITAYQNLPDKDPYANMNLNAAATNQTTLGVILTLVYLKPVDKPAIFSDFHKIETLMDTTGLKPLSSIMGEFPTPNVPRAKHWITTHKATKSMQKTIEHIMATTPHLDTIKSVPYGTGVFSWQPIAPSLVEAGRCGSGASHDVEKNNYKGNSMGLEPVAQNWFHLDVLWQSAADDDKVAQAAQAIVDEIESAARNEGSYLPYLFMNDAHEGVPVIASYGADNVRRMWEASKRYDPHQVFQKLLPGGFKLPPLP